MPAHRAPGSNTKDHDKKTAVHAYDFKRPNKFSRDHVRALQMVCETFSRHLGTLLATTLRAMTSATVGSVEQLTYDEYIANLPNPSYMVILALHPLPGAAILQLPLPIATTAIDRMLGGTGAVTLLDRPLTEIESSLMKSLTERALQDLAFSFESLVALQPEIMQQESNPQFAQIAAPSDMCVVLSLDLRIEDQRGAMTVCIPFDSLQPVLETFASQSLFSDRTDGDPADFSRQLEDAMRNAPVEINVRFHEVTLTSQEIVNLAVGDVVPLRHALDEPVIVSVGNTACFRALTGRKGRRIACLVVSSERDNPA